MQFLPGAMTFSLKVRGTRRTTVALDVPRFVFACLPPIYMHYTSQLQLFYFKRRKVLAEKHAQAWGEHAKVALEGWS